jgi:hypothetical protein
VKINATVAIEDNDNLGDLIRELDKMLDEGWTMDQIDIYRAAKTVPQIKTPGISTIYNETHLSHNGGLRP